MPEYMKPCPICNFPAMNVGFEYITCGKPSCWGQTYLRVPINNDEENAIYIWNSREKEEDWNSSDPPKHKTLRLRLVDEYDSQWSEAAGCWVDMGYREKRRIFWREI